MKETFARVAVVAVALFASQSSASSASDPKHIATNGQPAAFLLSSMELYNRLQSGDPSARDLAPEFWRLANSFASLASQNPQDAYLYEPLFAALQGAMDNDAVRGQAINLAMVKKIDKSLAEQVRIANGWGAFPGQRHNLSVAVRAWNAEHTREIRGLYVWLDLICCVRPGRSSKPFLTATSPAIDRVIPGTYLVRLVRGDKVVAKREVSIGLDYAPNAVVDVVVQ